MRTLYIGSTAAEKKRHQDLASADRQFNQAVSQSLAPILDKLVQQHVEFASRQTGYRNALQGILANRFQLTKSIAPPYGLHDDQGGNVKHLPPETPPMADGVFFYWLIRCQWSSSRNWRWSGRESQNHGCVTISAFPSGQWRFGKVSTDSFSGDTKGSGLYMDYQGQWHGVQPPVTTIKQAVIDEFTTRRLNLSVRTADGFMTP